MKKVKTAVLWLLLIIKTPIILASMACIAIGRVLGMAADLIPSPQFPKMLELTEEDEEEIDRWKDEN